MAGSFFSPDGDLDGGAFVNDYAIIDEFAKTGSLWTWGSNNYGQLGTNDLVHRSSPVQTVAGGTNWKSVDVSHAWESSSLFHTTVAIKTDGTLWMWGPNGSGQLGDGTTVAKSSPVQTVAAGTNWKQASTSGTTTAAIKTDGTLWMWGSGTSGVLGDGTIVAKSSPVQTVAAGTDWKQVSCAYAHTAAIKNDGTLWVWGSNGSGQLGTNNQTFYSSPVQTVAAGTNWKQVSCGGEGFTAAIKTDGTLWTWGIGSFGTLGDGTAVSKSSPVQTIAGGTNWKQVAAGDYLTGAIKTDGTLWMWGQGNSGALGDGTITNKSSPVQTVAGGTNWKQVACGGSFTAAIKTDGTLWTWGYGPYGQLGDGTSVTKSSPVQTVAAGTNWKQVSAGYIHAAAIYFYDAGNLYPSA